MKIALVASDLPHPEGTAAGRDLWAWGEALVALGHELEAWVWVKSPLSPEGPVPAWARYEPLALRPSLGVHLRALVTPRLGPALAGWRPDPDAVALADHVFSAGAVVGFPRSAVTLHYRALADARSVRRLSPADVQTARAERRAARHAALVLAYSARVGRHLAKPAHLVPLTYPLPPEPLPVVDEPVAALMADWSWRPNRTALRLLLAAWPDVRAAVPGARLLLAGRDLPGDAVGGIAGVEVLGSVARSADVLGRAAVVAFPCPSSSGPKVKTLEALGHGIPVVTTAAGAEGIALPADPGAMVGPPATFAARLAAVLRSPEERARLSATGRAAVLAGHAPEVAARARVDAFADAFGIEA